MTYTITSLCLRYKACVDACPVDVIVPGEPKEEWPWFYIDPIGCIDCGACVPVCIYDAIFAEDEVPGYRGNPLYRAMGGEFISLPELDGHWEGEDVNGKLVVLDTTRQLEAGEEVDLAPAVNLNFDYFEAPRPDGTEPEKVGPGYEAVAM